MRTTFGREFFVAEHDLRASRVAHISRTGKLVQEFKVKYPLDLQLLDNGHLLLSSNRALVELDGEFHEVWRYEQRRASIHSCQKLKNGNVLFGDSSKSMICEIDPSGKRVREFDFPLVDTPNDYLHAFRLIRTTADDKVLIAAHLAKKLVKCDWKGNILWQADLPGQPYMPIQFPDGEILVSLGPTGLIARVNAAGKIIWHYDMVRDSQLERGWIAGISALSNGNIVYSDSTYDRLVEIGPNKSVEAIFQNRKILLHPSTHIIVE